MSAVPDANWAEGRSDTDLSPEEQAVERNFELLDRVIGLEEQLREIRAADLLGPTEVVAVERNLASLRSSTTWRAGRVVTLPIRAARLIKRRLLG